jgi:hypothetical protein
MEMAVSTVATGERMRPISEGGVADMKGVTVPGSRLWLYAGVVILAGFGIIVASWSESAVRAVPVVVLAFWFFFAMVSESLWASSASGKGMVGLSLSAHLALLYELPLPHALTVGASGVLFSDLFLHQRSPIRSNFRAAQTAIALAISCLAIRGLGLDGASTGSQSFLLAPVAALAALPIYFLASTALASFAFALLSGEPPWRAWRDHYGHGYQVLNSLAFYLAGLGVVIGVESIGYVAGLAALLAILIARDGAQSYFKSRSMAATG